MSPSLSRWDLNHTKRKTSKTKLITEVSEVEMEVKMEVNSLTL
jgi:hypothetical protein